ncbi:CGNR zinc finger domain-containing protein [Nocardioides anomalus]|uniref:CGNR zinc finger domain-containing protein n=1 Tax=Nocardioides anomalus TaxID=2712223 RepID=UPI001E2B46AD|nr:CGNR zinc finger domain-containing protein [Nocardioides anomalus]
MRAGLLALADLELLLARAAGVLARLKVCANPDCGAAFFDASKNSSRRWHDVKTCGNTANLRASRERRRVATA